MLSRKKKKKALLVLKLTVEGALVRRRRKNWSDGKKKGETKQSNFFAREERKKRCLRPCLPCFAVASMPHEEERKGFQGAPERRNPGPRDECKEGVGSASSPPRPKEKKSEQPKEEKKEQRSRNKKPAINESPRIANENREGGGGGGGKSRREHKVRNLMSPASEERPDFHIVDMKSRKGGKQ